MDDKNLKAVKKIITHAEKAMSYCKGMDAEGFLANETIAEASIFNVMQIGEAARCLGDGFMDAHDTIPWHKIRGLRNRIVHNYEGVDFLLVWDVINGDLPDLTRQLNHLVL